MKSKSMLLYSVDNLFIRVCKARFENLYEIDVTSSTSVTQALIEKKHYDIAIFDTLFSGQCDNLVRYCLQHGARNTYIVMIVTTNDEEHHYMNNQRMLNINKVLRKPITLEDYHSIINYLKIK